VSLEGLRATLPVRPSLSRWLLFELTILIASLPTCPSTLSFPSPNRNLYSPFFHSHFPIARLQPSLPSSYSTMTSLPLSFPPLCLLALNRPQLCRHHPRPNDRRRDQASQGAVRIQALLRWCVPSSQGRRSFPALQRSCPESRSCGLDERTSLLSLLSYLFPLSLFGCTPSVDHICAVVLLFV
jgi:hypothetical protein